jgi:HEAT repeat protein
MAEKDTGRIVPALIQAATDRDAQVRNAALDALHVVGPDDPSATDAINTLIAGLRDADPRVRATAAGVLSTFKPRPEAAIPGLMESATADLGPPAQTGDPVRPQAGPTAAQNSIDRNQRDHARASAVAALAVIGGKDPEAQKTLVNLAGDAIPEVRMAVARTLGELGPGTPGAFVAELKLASDSDMYIQARAVTALGSFPQEYITSCPILYRAYLSKQRPLQEGAELSLDQIIKSGKFDAKAAGHSKDAALRFAAVFGLNPNSNEGWPALLQALKDTDPGVRLLAVNRLGGAAQTRAESALKALQPLADDPDADVRNQVRHCQRFLAPKPAKAAN